MATGEATTSPLIARIMFLCAVLIPTTALDHTHVNNLSSKDICATTSYFIWFPGWVGNGKSQFVQRKISAHNSGRYWSCVISRVILLVVLPMQYRLSIDIAMTDLYRFLSVCPLLLRPFMANLQMWTSTQRWTRCASRCGCLQLASPVRTRPVYITASALVLTTASLQKTTLTGRASISLMLGPTTSSKELPSPFTTVRGAVSTAREARARARPVSR